MSNFFVACVLSGFLMTFYWFHRENDEKTFQTLNRILWDLRLFCLDSIYLTECVPHRTLTPLFCRKSGSIFFRPRPISGKRTDQPESVCELAKHSTVWNRKFLCWKLFLITRICGKTLQKPFVPLLHAALTCLLFMIIYLSGKFCVYHCGKT